MNKWVKMWKLHANFDAFKTKTNQPKTTKFVGFIWLVFQTTQTCGYSKKIKQQNIAH